MYLLHFYTCNDFHYSKNLQSAGHTYNKRRQKMCLKLFCLINKTNFKCCDAHIGFLLFHK